MYELKTCKDILDSVMNHGITCCRLNLLWRKISVAQKEQQSSPTLSVIFRSCCEHLQGILNVTTLCSIQVNKYHIIHRSTSTYRNCSNLCYICLLQSFWYYFISTCMHRYFMHSLEIPNSLSGWINMDREIYRQSLQWIERYMHIHRRENRMLLYEIQKVKFWYQICKSNY